MSASRNLVLEVDPRVYAGLERMAKAANVPVKAYSRMLLDAAYTARCGETGDRDLDTAVSRVALLYGAREFDTLDIAQRVGMSEAFVERTISAWRDQLRGQGARAGAA